jgi:hypothetical protein
MHVAEQLQFLCQHEFSVKICGIAIYYISESVFAESTGDTDGISS